MLQFVQAQNCAPAHQLFHLQTLHRAYKVNGCIPTEKKKKKKKVKWSYVTIYLFPNLSMTILFL